MAYVNNVILVGEYSSGDSIPVIAERHGIPRSAVRNDHSRLHRKERAK